MYILYIYIIAISYYYIHILLLLVILYSQVLSGILVSGNLPIYFVM